MGALSCELGSCSAAGAAPNRKLSRKNRRKVILLLLYWKRVVWQAIGSLYALIYHMGRPPRAIDAMAFKVGIDANGNANGNAAFICHCMMGI